MTSTAFQKMAHFDGEEAVARAGQKDGTPLVLSSNSNTTIEKFAENNQDSPKFYQIYMSRSKDVNIDIWDRVKRAGFKGFALTCDTQLLGKRYQDVRNKFNLPHHLSIANYEKYKN